MINSRSFSRRRALQGSAAGFAVGALAASGLHRAASAAQDSTPVASDDLQAAIDAILADPQYVPSRLGIYVADRATGETVYDIRADEWFLAASTTKVFSGAAALDALGADFRFETPIYRTGPIDADGVL